MNQIPNEISKKRNIALCLVQRMINCHACSVMNYTTKYWGTENY